MKRLITPNTVILMVLAVALIHLHACTGAQHKTGKGKAVLKNTRLVEMVYVNNVQLPNVGDPVRVTDSYMLDSHNDWKEIHPATKIEKLN